VTILDLERLARRGAEDGYDDEWHSTFTASARALASMKTAADAARTAMTTEQLLTAIHHELCAIRNALEKAPATVAAPVARPMMTSSDEVPQPSTVIADAGSVTVHFGKNTGIPLSSLSDKSVAWYAQEQEPKLDRNGKPFPPRDADVRLRNAARTYLHMKRGTLTAAAPQARVDASSSIDDTDVNF
jgi:hypothetical protein